MCVFVRVAGIGLPGLYTRCALTLSGCTLSGNSLNFCGAGLSQGATVRVSTRQRGLKPRVDAGGSKSGSAAAGNRSDCDLLVGVAAWN